MPGITQSGTYSNPRMDLAQAVAEFDTDQQLRQLIGFQVLPAAPVPRQAASFAKITRESLLRRANVRRTKGGDYNRDGFETEDDSYECLEYGLENPLDDSERSFYQNDFDGEFWSAQSVFVKLMTEHEIRVATAVFDSSSWTGAALTTAVSTEWSTITADILGDVQGAKEKVRTVCGIDPRHMAISRKVWLNVRKNTALIDSVKYTEKASDAVVKAAIAAYLDLDQIFVGGGVYNSAKEGQTFVSADIWDDEYASIFVGAQPGAPVKTPCLGRTFVWEEDSPESGGLAVEEYRWEKQRSWIYRARHNVDEKIIDLNFAHLLSNITA